MANKPPEVTRRSAGGSRLLQVVSLLNRAAIELSAGIVILMALLVFTGVVARYLFAHPLVWIDELISASIPLVSLLVASWLIEQGGHVRIELLQRRISGKTAVAGALLIWLCCFMTSVLILVSGVQAVSFLYEYGIRSPSLLGLPDWILNLSIPTGGALMTLSSIAVFPRLAGSELLTQRDNRHE